MSTRGPRLSSVWAASGAGHEGPQDPLSPDAPMSRQVRHAGLAHSPPRKARLSNPDARAPT